MKVSNDLLLKAEGHRDPDVRKFAADARALEAEELKGKAFHERSRRLEAIDAALRLICHGGIPLPAALETVGLTEPGARTALGTNPADVAAVPMAKR